MAKIEGQPDSPPYLPGEADATTRGVIVVGRVGCVRVFAFPQGRSRARARARLGRVVFRARSRSARPTLPSSIDRFGAPARLGAHHALGASRWSFAPEESVARVRRWNASHRARSRVRRRRSASARARCPRRRRRPCRGCATSSPSRAAQSAVPVDATSRCFGRRVDLDGPGTSRKSRNSTLFRTGAAETGPSRLRKGPRAGRSPGGGTRDGRGRDWSARGSRRAGRMRSRRLARKWRRSPRGRFPTPRSSRRCAVSAPPARARRAVRAAAARLKELKRGTYATASRGTVGRRKKRRAALDAGVDVLDVEKAIASATPPRWRRTLRTRRRTRKASSSRSTREPFLVKKRRRESCARLEHFVRDRRRGR